MEYGRNGLWRVSSRRAVFRVAVHRLILSSLGTLMPQEFATKSRLETKAA